MSRSTKPATTQSVLEAFVFVRSDKNKAIRLFYEWLEQRDAEVAKATEERIIKLLEGLDCEKNGNPNHDTHDCLYYMTADSLIALIKGEK